MSKMNDFYVAVLSDNEARKEFSSILDGKEIDKANDEQLEKIGALAERLGYKITLSEAKAFLKESSCKLSEEELDAVAGGGNKRKDVYVYYCDVGGQAGIDDKNFGPNAEPVNRGC